MELIVASNSATEFYDNFQEGLPYWCRILLAACTLGLADGELSLDFPLAFGLALGLGLGGAGDSARGRLMSSNSARFLHSSCKNAQSF